MQSGWRNANRLIKKEGEQMKIVRTQVECPLCKKGRLLRDECGVMLIAENQKEAICVELNICDYCQGIVLKSHKDPKEYGW